MQDILKVEVGGTNRLQVLLNLGIESASLEGDDVRRS